MGVSAFGQKTTAMDLLSALALSFLFSAASSFHLSDSIPMEAAPLREEDLELIKRGETDLTTMATFSIKVYVTPEVVAQYPNYTESVEYLIEILNKQRSKIPIMAELHCIEETQTSEAEGMNLTDYEVQGYCHRITRVCRCSCALSYKVGESSEGRWCGWRVHPTNWYVNGFCQ